MRPTYPSVCYKLRRN
ncbi:hypothetical protein F383_04199 [Gossypium arboreum]|uniref:Uncharacterized protein n=1 Tax=Gossypium arboreum TaxID=29729 RepID=A0A0B0PHB9_GOSAR|nr:hypothetical protein F383_04199 [Gossypium arboreum]